MRKAIPLPRFQAENAAILQRLLDAVGAIGAKHGATTTQVALAWLLAQGNNVIPIPGTTKIEVRSLLVCLTARGDLTTAPIASRGEPWRAEAAVV